MSDQETRIEPCVEIITEEPVSQDVAELRDVLGGKRRPVADTPPPPVVLAKGFSRHRLIAALACVICMGIGIFIYAADDPTSEEIPMVYVRGGTFTMGCTAEQGNYCIDDEKPAHEVTVGDFRIGKYEVTQTEWKTVMGNNPSFFEGDNLPVEKVNWNEVQEFIQKLNTMTGGNYRLPTEAEWEYAARGGSQARGFKYSGSNSIGDVAWYDWNSGSKTHPVGTKRANELGIYDMAGNVYEWVQDWFGGYNSGSQTNPVGPSSGSYRVRRGGSWGSFARSARVSFRLNVEPGDRYDNLGFRLASSSR
jgi:formylglycine-generating enzyme required for sulfatase activity